MVYEMGKAIFRCLRQAQAPGICNNSCIYYARQQFKEQIFNELGIPVAEPVEGTEFKLLMKPSRFLQHPDHHINNDQDPNGNASCQVSAVFAVSGQEWIVKQ